MLVDRLKEGAHYVVVGFELFGAVQQMVDEADVHDVPLFRKGRTKTWVCDKVFDRSRMLHVLKHNCCVRFLLVLRH